MEYGYSVLNHDRDLEGLYQSTPAVVGDFQDKKVVKGNKPLFIVLTIIGLISLGVVGGMGFANLGNHLHWWPVAGFTHLSQVGAIAMVASGGGVGLLLIIGGLIGLAKTSSSKGESLELRTERIDQPLTEAEKIENAALQLINGSYTWVLQENGFYTLMIKHFPGEDEIDGKIEKLSNIHWDNMNAIGWQNGRTGEGDPRSFYFIKTSPMPTDMEWSEKEIEKKVTDGQCTFVLQQNGYYTLVKKYANCVHEYTYNYQAAELYPQISNCEVNHGLSYVETSPWPFEETRG